MQLHPALVWFTYSFRAYDTKNISCLANIPRLVAFVCALVSSSTRSRVEGCTQVYIYIRKRQRLAPCPKIKKGEKTSETSVPDTNEKKTGFFIYVFLPSLSIPSLSTYREYTYAYIGVWDSIEISRYMFFLVRVRSNRNIFTRNKQTKTIGWSADHPRPPTWTLSLSLAPTNCRTALQKKNWRSFILMAFFYAFTDFLR